MMERELLDALKKRYATKKFDPAKKLKTSQVDTLIEAIRLTPTSYGLQLMRAVVIEDNAVREQLIPHSYNQRQVADASHLILLCRIKDVSTAHVDQYIENISQTRGVALETLNGFKNSMNTSIEKKSEEEIEIWLSKQVYIALGNMMNACALLEIDACPMEGFKPKIYDEILGLDQLNLASVLAIPVGYRSENDHHSRAKKVRVSREEFLIRL